MANFKLRYVFPSGRRTIEMFETEAQAIDRFFELSTPEAGCTNFELQGPNPEVDAETLYATPEVDF